MSLFTKHRKVSRQKKKERYERLMKGFAQIDRTMTRIQDGIKSLPPDFESYPEDKKQEILRHIINND